MLIGHMDYACVFTIIRQPQLFLSVKKLFLDIELTVPGFPLLWLDRCIYYGISADTCMRYTIIFTHICARVHPHACVRIHYAHACACMHHPHACGCLHHVVS